MCDTKTDNNTGAAVASDTAKVRLCPVCKQPPKVVYAGGNATKGNMRFKVECCSLEFFGAQNFLAYMARESAIYNWNYCIDRM